MPVASLIYQSRELDPILSVSRYVRSAQSCTGLCDVVQWMRSCFRLSFVVVVFQVVVCLVG